MFKDELSNFIKEQLQEMARNVAINMKKNIKKRGHNPFSIFEGDEEKYMAVGRSLDSQLGNRLQRIAFYISRYRYGFENVPNIVLMNKVDSRFRVRLISYPIINGMTQCFAWGDDFLALLNKDNRKFYEENAEKFAINDYYFDNVDVDEIKKIIDEKGAKIPIDLFFLDEDWNAHAYEIKAGGNLDTKNKEGNASEVLRLEKIFSMMGKNTSKFATCYNNKGEGNIPDGAIFGVLDEEHKVIGKAFWEEILPAEINYEEFIQIYTDSFNEANVREIIAGNE